MGVVDVAGEHTGTAGLGARYAAGLFELADEAKQLDAVAADLRAIRALIAESADLRRLVRSPVLTRAEQGKAIAAVLERAGTSDLVRPFVGPAAQTRPPFPLPALIAAPLSHPP